MDDYTLKVRWIVLTKNQKKVLRLLAVSYSKDYSINDVARRVSVAPNGAYKILRKFQKEGILIIKEIANIKSYRLYFENENTVRLLELAFSDGMDGRLKLRAQDVQRLKPVTEACVIFGSYTTNKPKPSDLDVLFVMEKQKFEQYKKELAKVQDITPIKIQDVVQTSADLLQNLKKNDPIITEALRNGVVLWGINIVVRVIKNSYK